MFGLNGWNAWGRQTTDNTEELAGYKMLEDAGERMQWLAADQTRRMKQEQWEDGFKQSNEIIKLIRENKSLKEELRVMDTVHGTVMMDLTLANMALLSVIEGEGAELVSKARIVHKRLCDDKKSNDDANKNIDERILRAKALLIAKEETQRQSA